MGTQCRETPATREEIRPQPTPKTLPQLQAKKPPQVANAPEQAFIPEFLHRPSQNTPKPPAEPSDRLGLDDKKRTNDNQFNERD